MESIWIKAVDLKKGDILNWLKKYKHTWIIPVYGLFYMSMFVFLENRKNLVIHIIHTGFDDLIPFNEYFIIPYFCWYGFVFGVTFYFSFINKNKEEYYRLVATLGTGMTIFLIVSFLYPNGHNLRPVLSGNHFFINAVRVLYQVDTPTNIFPSIHVFNTVACCCALRNNKRCQKHPVLLITIGILSVFIILSTLFLKQHSIIDVVAAVLLNVLCYHLFYKMIPQKRSGFLMRNVKRVE